MSVSHIPPHTVSLLLQYISPLDGPLPPHLISKSLLQRHHFLHLSPEDPLSYLCWPSEDLPRISSLLDALQPPQDAKPFPVQYTSDDEHSFAQVHIPTATRGEDGLRLIFQWDAEDAATTGDGTSWRYHDARLMPFPPRSHDSPHGPLLSDITAGSGSENRRNLSENHGVDSVDDDDDYWNAYGSRSIEDPADFQRSISTLSFKDSSDEKAEDAYWAQYASVQGSGDSTLPSPRISRRKLHHPSQPLPPPISTQSPALSPHALELRLAGLSPRPSPLSTPPPTSGTLDATFDSPMMSGSPTLSDPSLGETHDGKDTTLPRQPTSVGGQSHVKNGEHDMTVPCQSWPNGLRLDLVSSKDDMGVDGLTETIKGVYRLWASGRQRSRVESTTEEREVFIGIVRDVVKSL